MTLYKLPKQYHPDFKLPKVKPRGEVELDLSNSIAKKLKYFFLLNEFPVKCLVTGITGVNQGATLSGANMDFDGTGYIDFPSDDFWLTGDDPWTILFNMDLDSLSSGFGGILTPAYAKGASSNHNIFASTNGGYSPITMRVLAAGGGGYNSIKLSTFGTDPFNSHFWGISHNGIGSAVTNFQVYKDDLTGVAVSSSGTASVTQTQIGRYSSGNAMNGRLKYIAIFDSELTQAEVRRFRLDPYQVLKPKSPALYFTVEASSGVSITGTAVPTQTEADIVTGGKTVILTLSGDTFVTGTTSEDAIAGGSDSDKTGANKWDALIKTALDNTDLVLSGGNTIATITLPAFASYDTDETETITWTIPSASLTTGTSDIIATPTFTVTPVVVGGTISPYFYTNLLAS